VHKPFTTATFITTIDSISTRLLNSRAQLYIVEKTTTAEPQAVASTQYKQQQQQHKL